MLAPSEKPARMAMLLGERTQQLRYHECLLDLLATLCEGEVRFIESMCQAMLPLPQIMEVLRMPKIHIHRKLCYMRYLLWCFMNTAAGPVESGTSELDLDPDMWAYLGFVNDFLAAKLQGVKTEADVLKSFNAVGIDFVVLLCIAYFVRTHKFVCICTCVCVYIFLGRNSYLHNTHTTNTVLLQRDLQFIWEGLVPFTNIFFDVFFQLRRSKYTDVARTLLGHLLSLDLISDFIVKTADQRKVCVCVCVCVCVRVYLRENGRKCKKKR